MEGRMGCLLGLLVLGCCTRDWGECNRGRGVWLGFGWWNVVDLRGGPQCEVPVVGGGQCACDAEWNILLGDVVYP